MGANSHEREVWAQVRERAEQSRIQRLQGEQAAYQDLRNREVSASARRQGLLDAQQRDSELVRLLQAQIGAVQVRIRERENFRGSEEEFEAAWPEMEQQLLNEAQARKEQEDARWRQHMRNTFSL